MYCIDLFNTVLIFFRVLS